MPLTNPSESKLPAHEIDIKAHVPECALANFLETPATGDMTTPGNVNDDAVGDTAYATVQDQYADIDLGGRFLIDQWRIYGRGGNIEDGRWKLEYQDAQLVWHDWVTEIPTNQAVWTAMAPEVEVVARRVKVSMTTLDTRGGGGGLGELEVYHS